MFGWHGIIFEETEHAENKQSKAEQALLNPGKQSSSMIVMHMKGCGKETATELETSLLAMEREEFYVKTENITSSYT